MDYSVVMAGFGGQGVLLMGDLLAYCGMKEGLEVIWMPSYGVEMRGGAASCTVIISEKRIGAPIVGAAHAVIAMSEPALNKYRERLLPRGLLLINSSLIPAAKDWTHRDDVEELLVPARELAELVPSFLSPEKKKLAPAISKALAAGSAYAAATQSKPT